jgi:hypothetical protein
MFIFVMSYVCQNVIQFVLDFFSGELDLGTLGSYSGSPFLTPDAFLRSPDKDVLGECWPSFNVAWHLLPFNLWMFVQGVSAVRICRYSFLLICKSWSCYCEPIFHYSTMFWMPIVCSPEDKVQTCKEKCGESWSHQVFPCRWWHWLWRSEVR